jgi:hypothetical protein
LETKINAGQEELRQEINAFRERIKNIEAGQTEFEERVTHTLREDLGRNIEASQAEFEERVTHTLREDLGRNIEAGQDEFKERVTCAVDARLKNVLSVVEATRQDAEATRRDLEARTRRAGGGSAGTNADKVKPPKFDGSTSWIVFQRQFDAAAIHNDWTSRENAAHLLSILQGQAAHVLHSVPAEASYEDIVGRSETDSETTSWRRLTDHILRPGCRRVVRHCRSSPRPSNSWRTRPLLGFPPATFRRRPPTLSSMEYGTGK